MSESEQVNCEDSEAADGLFLSHVINHRLIITGKTDRLPTDLHLLYEKGGSVKISNL